MEWRFGRTCAHVIAPKRRLSIANGVLRMEEPDGAHVSHSIDSLLEALAKQQQEKRSPSFSPAAGPTEKEAERRQWVLLAESQHRVKNMLANVNSLIVLALRRSQSVEECAHALERWIGVMARAQDVLPSEERAVIGLRTLLLAELRVHGIVEDGRVSLTGPDLEVEPKTAQALAMVFHEPATNAAKYGVFTADTGRIEISWAVINSGAEWRFLFRWRESGITVAEPIGRGFGSQFIENSVPYMLGGTSQLGFQSDGVRYVINIPANGRTAEPERPPSANPGVLNW